MWEETAVTGFGVPTDTGQGQEFFATLSQLCFVCLCVDVDALKQQAANLYSRLQNVDLSVEKEQAEGFLERLWEKLEGFIVALF